MKKGPVIFIVLVAVILVVFGIRHFRQTGAIVTTSKELLRTKGSPDAQVKIIEYIDFQCPACAAGSQWLRKVFKEHSKDIYLEMRYFPLTMHKHAFISAVFAECSARQDKFWPMHDLIIDHQNQWKQLGNSKPAFEHFANQIGLDKAALDTCLQDETVHNYILQQKEVGKQKGIKSTPTYFINGEMVVGIFKLKEKLKDLLNVTIE